MSNSRIVVLGISVVLTLAGARPAVAQRRPAPAPAPAPAVDKDAEAKAHYEKGMKHYNLGEFDQAIEEFKKAYEFKEDPILLYNIGQAHRQKGDLEKAIFFYRRYLDAAPNAANKKDVQQRIKDLEELVKKQREEKDRPPTGVVGGTGTEAGTGAGTGAGA